MYSLMTILFQEVQDQYQGQGGQMVATTVAARPHKAYRMAGLGHIAMPCLPISELRQV